MLAGAVNVQGVALSAGAIDPKLAAAKPLVAEHETGALRAGSSRERERRLPARTVNFNDVSPRVFRQRLDTSGWQQHEYWIDVHESGFRAHGSNQRFNRLQCHAVATGSTRTKPRRRQPRGNKDSHSSGATAQAAERRCRDQARVGPLDNAADAQHGRERTGSGDPSVPSSPNLAAPHGDARTLGLSGAGGNAVERRAKPGSSPVRLRGLPGFSRIRRLRPVGRR